MTDKRNPLVVWGAGGHAGVVIDAARKERRFEVTACLDDINSESYGRKRFGIPVIGGREKLRQFADQGVRHLVVAVGDCAARLAMAKTARSEGLELATIVHPSAVLADDVEIGAGTVILAGAVINPGVSIGESVIINTSASIDHDCRIDDGVHISPGVHLGGRVSVKRRSWVGIGATVKDRIAIGANTLIGAGSVVVTDIPAGCLAYGVPAKVIRKN